MKTKHNPPKRVTGTHVPQTTPRASQGKQAHVAETSEEKIARLEKELDDARLRADLYEEIINVAEKKFDIQIRKKAGTKQ